MTNELKTSIRILTRIRNQLRNAYSGLEWLIDLKIKPGVYPPGSEEIFYINTAQLAHLHYAFSWYCSFEDEFKRHFKSLDPTERTQIEAIGQRCQPHIDAIHQKFPALRDARNMVLAHGYRNRSGNALDNDSINRLYNDLILHDSREMYAVPWHTAEAVMDEIEKVFGKLDDEWVAL